MFTNKSEIMKETIENASNDFLFHCRYEKNLSSKTIKAYGIDISQFKALIKTQGYCEIIKKIDKIIIKEFLKEISVHKPKTIKRKIATIKAMFNFFEFEDKIILNPFRKIKIQIKEPRELPKVMTIGEVKSIFKIAYTDKQKIEDVKTYSYMEITRDIAVLELLFTTGIRVAELCHLTLEQINLKVGFICVNGKGSKERVIQVCNVETKKALNEYYKLFAKQINQTGYFFINRYNQRLSEQSVRFMIRKYSDKANISKNITPHTFRHTFATLLLEENVDIKYIQHILGHSSIMTTQIYTHVNNDKQRKILNTNNPRKLFKAVDFTIMSEG